MKIKEELKKEYVKYFIKNSDDNYSRAVLIATEVFGNHLEDGKTCDEAERAMHNATGEVGGLTGFMMGCIMQALAHFDVRGDEVKKWWNKKNGIKEDIKGVVNPAILTVKDKK